MVMISFFWTFPRVEQVYAPARADTKRPGGLMLTEALTALAAASGTAVAQAAGTDAWKGFREPGRKDLWSW